jgi:hypothetical protein
MSKIVTCDCDKFQPMGLSSDALTERIKQTPRFLKRLEIVAEHDPSKNKLLKCESCGQHWQLAYAWSWGDRKYLFEIPEINSNEWLEEQFQKPDELIVYSAHMHDYFDRNDFTTTNAECRHEDCSELAIKYTVFCRDHHLESLQKSGVLPKRPTGRQLPYYSK